MGDLDWKITYANVFDIEPSGNMSLCSHIEDTLYIPYTQSGELTVLRSG